LPKGPATANLLVAAKVQNELMKKKNRKKRRRIRQGGKSILQGRRLDRERTQGKKGCRRGGVFCGFPRPIRKSTIGKKTNKGRGEGKKREDVPEKTISDRHSEGRKGETGAAGSRRGRGGGRRTDLLAPTKKKKKTSGERGKGNVDNTKL